MKLTKTHRVLKFKKFDWMKKYIEFNTKKSMNAPNDFEKDFFKLMINSVLGKTMENLLKRISVRLVTSEKDLLKYNNRPTHITHKFFDKNFAATHEIKPVLILYVGFTVQELSKWLMCDFYYNFIKRNFDAELLFTNTDSLTFGLKSKMYSLNKIDGKECNTAKGVNITKEFNKFKDVFLNKKTVRLKMKNILAKKHKIGTYKIDKISLSCFDDKRFVLDDENHTLAYFHKDSVISSKKM